MDDRADTADGLSEQQLRAALVGWSDIVYMQAKRLWDATEHFWNAHEDQRFRQAHAEQGSPPGWEDVLSEAPVTFTERDRTRMQADKYFLLLAAAQVVKCAERLPNDALPVYEDADELKLLRNLEEHWEDPDGRSARELRETIPDFTPGRVGFDGKRLWIERISLGDLVDWVTVVEMRVRDAARRLGPDLRRAMTSSGSTTYRLTISSTG